MKKKNNDELFEVKEVTEEESNKYSNDVKLPKKYVSDRLPFKKIKDLFRKKK